MTQFKRWFLVGMFVVIAGYAHSGFAVTNQENLDAIAKLLKVYQASDTNGPIILQRIGRANDGGYVIPELAIQKADVVLGYGILNDISFEEQASAIYQKPAYGFDCTSPSPHIENKEVSFVSSCIVSNDCIASGAENCSSFNREKISSFDQQLDTFNLRGKKIFIKMDIEGNEYDTIPDILRHATNVTGIVMEIHFMDDAQITKALNLMQALNKDFLLIHVHGNSYCQHRFTTKHALGSITRVSELTYINRNLVSNYAFSLNQSHPTQLDMSNCGGKDVEFTIRD